MKYSVPKYTGPKITDMSVLDNTTPHCGIDNILRGSQMNTCGDNTYWTTRYSLSSCDKDLVNGRTYSKVKIFKTLRAHN